ncbi:hypothetical protein BDQ17DRAFT_1358459 [Cyathus striatus]|nr:hypothetical protein BDQ17DRAFT_1358459 [Cyathus striatus]
MTAALLLTSSILGHTDSDPQHPDFFYHASMSVMDDGQQFLFGEIFCDFSAPIMILVIKDVIMSWGLGRRGVGCLSAPAGVTCLSTLKG